MNDLFTVTSLVNEPWFVNHSYGDDIDNVIGLIPDQLASTRGGGEAASGHRTGGLET